MIHHIIIKKPEGMYFWVTDMEKPKGDINTEDDSAMYLLYLKKWQDSGAKHKIRDEDYWEFHYLAYDRWKNSSVNPKFKLALDEGIEIPNGLVEITQNECKGNNHSGACLSAMMPKWCKEHCGDRTPYPYIIKQKEEQKQCPRCKSDDVRHADPIPEFTCGECGFDFDLKKTEVDQDEIKKIEQLIWLGKQSVCKEKCNCHIECNKADEYLEWFKQKFKITRI